MPCRGGVQSSREHEAWEKLNALWVREVARWDQERVLWDQKEKRLLDHIFQLQDLVMRLSMQTTSQQTPPQAPSLPATSSQTEELATSREQPASPKREASTTNEPQITARQQQGSAAAAQSRQPSVLEEASRFMPPEPQPFQPVPAEEFAPLEVVFWALSGRTFADSMSEQDLTAKLSLPEHNLFRTHFRRSRSESLFGLIFYQGPG